MWKLAKDHGQPALGETGRQRVEPNSESQKFFAYARQLSMGSTQGTSGKLLTQLLETNFLGALHFVIAKNQREKQHWTKKDEDGQRRLMHTALDGLLLGSITESIMHVERAAAAGLGVKNAMARRFTLLDIVPEVKPRFEDGFAIYSIIPVEERRQLELNCWAQAYHHTSAMNMASIVEEGFNLPKSKEDVVHGAAGDANVSHTYTSPSLQYAAHPVYATFLKLQEEKCAMQLVFRVLVRDTNKCNPNTLAEKHWPRDLPIDPRSCV